METGRTFATLLADHHLRRQLVEVVTEQEFKQLLFNRTRELIEEQHQSRSAVSIKLDAVVEPPITNTAMSNVSFAFRDGFLFVHGYFLCS